ncbi:putative cytosolic iron-sulfur protein assembly protein CIAO1-like protein [Aphelenchoides bicaudatus]|nr:putative cytosolic iron-sulfur protein assembly protein CIAO1-like protein [Aphelenchoides bicaudatus]
MMFEELTRFTHSKSSQKRVWCTNWAHNGKSLLSTGEDKIVKIWSFNKDKKSTELATQISGDNIRTIRCACFSPCGKYLATASFDASVILYEFNDGIFEERHKLDGHENEVKCVAFSISGQYLATSSRDKSVFIWQFDEDNDLDVDVVLQQHSGDVKFVVWSPNEDVLLSGGYDFSLIFYRVDGDEWTVQQKIQTAHEDTVWNAQFDSSGNYLISVGGDSKMKVWKKNIDVPNSKWPIYTVSFDHFSDKFAVGGEDRILWVYELDKTNDTVNLLHSQKFPSDINCIAFNPVHSGILSLACDDGTIVIGQLNV